MASSTIKRYQPVINMEENAVTFGVNANFSANSNFVHRKYGQVVQFRIEFQGTVSEWGTGGDLYAGNMTGAVPRIVTYVPCMRQDSGLFVGWLVIGGGDPNTTVGCNLKPLTNVPQNVVLIASGTYICG